MGFNVGTYKEFKNDREANIKCNGKKGECDFCKTKFSLDDAIISQFDIRHPNDGITKMHMKCFIDILRKNNPDFWKKYMLELI